MSSFRYDPHKRDKTNKQKKNPHDQERFDSLIGALLIPGNKEPNRSASTVLLIRKDPLDPSCNLELPRMDDLSAAFGPCTLVKSLAFLCLR